MLDEIVIGICYPHLGVESPPPRAPGFTPKCVPVFVTFAEMVEESRTFKALSCRMTSFSFRRVTGSNPPSSIGSTSFM